MFGATVGVIGVKSIFDVILAFVFVAALGFGEAGFLAAVDFVAFEVICGGIVEFFWC